MCSHSKISAIFPIPDEANPVQTRDYPFYHCYFTGGFKLCIKLQLNWQTLMALINSRQIVTRAPRESIGRQPFCV